MKRKTLFGHDPHGRSAVVWPARTFWLIVAITSGCSGASSVTEPATGSIEIITATAGAKPDLDPDGYIVFVDDGPERNAATEGMITIGQVPQGSRLLRLSGLASNCSVTGSNPVRVDVAPGSVTRWSFSVRCRDPLEGPEGDWDY